MSKRYSLFNGAGAASLRRLGVLLAMLLSTAWCSVSYADAGFQDTNTMDLKINTDANGTYWLYYPANNADSKRFETGNGIWQNTYEDPVDLGNVTAFTIVRPAVTMWAKDNTTINSVSFQYQLRDQSNNIVGGSSRDWNMNSGHVTYAQGGTIEYAANINIDVITTFNLSSSPGQYTLEFWLKASTSAGDKFLNNQDQNYKITFTIPQQGPVFSPSETMMYFGNVPYEPNGEGKLSTVHFEYNGSTPLSGNTETEAGISFGSRGAFFEFVGIGNNGTDGWITYRFRPDETNSNKSFTNGTHRISLTKDDEPLTVIFNASSFTPLIAGSREPVRAQSIAELSGAIMYTGCNTIEEYGVYYSTDPDFFDSATNTVDMSKSQVANVKGVAFGEPVDNLTVTVDGLMSGTTYYYIWYMKDSDGQTTFDAVLNFTTNEGDYRLAVNDAVAGTETYYGFIYEGETIGGTNDITTGYVQYWLSCTPSQTYCLQFNYMQEDGTYKWIDVPDQGGTIPSTYSQSYVRIEGTDLKKDNSAYADAKLSAPVQKGVPAADYTYNVYFTNADGSAVTDNDGSDLVMTVTGVESATIKGGQSGTFEQFPEGSQYRVERVYKNQPDVACEIGSGAVPKDFTGPISTDEVLNVTYTGGDLAPEFSISRDLWVYTNDNATGTTQTPENTMTQISCADGVQGRTADYSLLFSLDDPAGTIPMSPFDIRSGNSSEVMAHNDTSWNAQIGHNDLYARYMYYSGATSDQDRTYVDFVRRDGEDARLKLVFFNSSNVSVGDYTMVRTEGSQKYTYTFKESESIPQGAAYVTVRGCEPWSDAYNIKMHAAEIPVSGITGGEFTYDLAANCLTVEISGLQFAGEAGQEIQIGEDNKVSLCVENINVSGSVLADQYSVVLTDNKTGRPMPFDGQTEDIAAGGQVCLITVDPLENLNNYNLRAELLFGGAVVDEASLENCIRPEGDTIYYTIDNTLTYNDACALQFRTIGAAMTDLKTDVNYYDAGSKNLLKHIVFKIVGGNGDYVGETDNNVSGGDVNTKVNMISDINNGDKPANEEYKVFIMRNADYENPEVGKPVVNHVVIRNSRNVQLLYLDIQGYTKNTTSYDNAIDIDNGNGNWVQTETAGLYSNGQIEVRFCDISSMGFTCVHLSAYDNVLFEDNHITANIDPDYSNPNNQRDWGASIKFIRCSNVKFLRNTFRGQHITNMWLQECDKVLVMNNVFWTENAQHINTGGNSVAMIRMMSQTGEGTEYRALPVQNIGVYYNTFYISATNVLARADFLKFGGDAKYQNGRALEYKNVDFNYNNCYSMDDDEINCSLDPLWQTQDTGNSRNIDVRYNNFWTVAEGDIFSEQGMQSSLSIYAIPEGTGETENDVVYNINVPGQMCSTANDNPDGLVVRGTGLNRGKTIKDDISGQGAEDLNNDRLYPTVGLDGVRPYKAEEGWTLGAYQQSDARQPLGTIYWFGGSDDITGQAWDLRSNWRCYDMLTGALRQVDCLDTFSDTLLVIVPAPNSTRFPVPEGGVKSYPRIPTNFYNDNGERDEISKRAYSLGEGVQAGLGTGIDMSNNPWYFKTVYIEYGGTLLFANYLYNNHGSEEVRHYEGASASYVGPRDIWALTGTVIRPFVDQDNKDLGVRNVISGDYYLNREPNVYMRYADVQQSEGQVEWTRAFPHLNVEVQPGMQFAVYFPNEYGWPIQTDNEYAASTGKTQFINHGDSALTFNFYGRFAAESALPFYKDLTPGEYNLLNNYLPANLSAKAILDAPGVEDIKYYVAGTNGNMGSFVSVTEQSLASAEEGDLMIYPKNGFLVKSTLKELQITSDMVVNSHTQIYDLRNMAETYPYMELIANKDKTPYGSQVAVEVNPNVNAYNFDEFSTSKLFQGTPDMTYVPDVYIMMGEGYKETVAVPDAETVIPLGVRVREAMDLNFYVKYIDGINEVWLEDRATGGFYPIVNYMGTIRGLEPADYQGRFYLHLSSNSEEEDPDEEENPDIDVPTDVEETTAASGIDIFNTEGVITVSSTSDIALSAVYVTDMAGRTRSYKASGNYVRIVTDLVPGVYVVNAVGDKESTERKIVVK